MERSETDSSGCVRATSAGDPQAVVAGGSSDPSISSAASGLRAASEVVTLQKDDFVALLAELQRLQEVVRVARSIDTCGILDDELASGLRDALAAVEPEEAS